MTYNDTPDAEKIAKLPKWASAYIERLERERDRYKTASEGLRDDARVEGTEQFFVTDTSGNVTWIPNDSIHRSTANSSADSPRRALTFSSNPPTNPPSGLGVDVSVMAGGGGALLSTPRASNALLLTARDR